MKNTLPDIEETDTAVCPYCGTLNHDVCFPIDTWGVDGLSEDCYENKAICKKCEKTFKWVADVKTRVTFNTYKIGVSDG